VSRCSAIKSNGERCKGRANKGSEWCWNHNPSHADAHRRHGSRGGRCAGRGRPVAELARLGTRFEELADIVLRGELDRADGAVAGQLLNGARACVRDGLKARELEELECRLEELERVLEQHQTSGGYGRGA
jgi:hypothetical protein